MVSRDKYILTWLTLIAAAIARNEGPRCPSQSSGLCQEDGSLVDEYFYIITGHKIIIQFSGVYFYFTCTENITLENKHLPQFSQRTEIEKVKLTSCPPPAGGYESALLNFNVTARTCLELDKVPSLPAMVSQHLEGLRIVALAVEGADRSDPLQLDAGFLAPLVPTLRDLKLEDALVPPQALRSLPPELRALTLRRTGVAELPAAALTRLPRLQQLVLAGAEPLRVAAGAGSPITLFVDAPLTALEPGRAENVSLWNPRNVTLSGDCAALQRLEVVNATLLPARWLARCAFVTELRLRWMGAGTVGAGELSGATALLLLQVRNSGLRTLPADWLEDTADLTELDLSDNKIETLPAGLFATATRLQTLLLTNNRLARLEPALLGPLPALATLGLGHNPLGDQCGWGASRVPNAVSPLRELRALRTLQLAATGATRVCRDWRALPRLARLDLADNNITQLAFSDLEWAVANVSVDLRGSKITSLEYTRADYERVARANGTVLALALAADWALGCDCLEYWAARAARERPAHAPTLRRARCAPGAAAPGLADPDPDDFMCTVDEKECPAGCRCAVHERGTALSCARPDLPPAPRALPPVRRVRAAGLLRALSPALLTPDLMMLDVSNNSLSKVSAETAALLFAAPQRRVWLADNPWECDCGALPLLRAVAANVARAPDATRARCASGRALLAAAAALDAACARAAWASWAWAWAPAALALLAAGSVLALAASRPRLRQRVKGFLFERGLCLRWLLRPFDADEAPDATRPYDAFVSFSHHDAAYAMELVTRLEGEEGGAGGRRLCLHERDWTPGEWIPAQIAASVRAARRTLVLLSESFLQSQWARAEFREAYSAALREHRPRLLLLLLPGVSPDALAALRAEPELRAYLARVTYLRWEDPRFWHKLDLALPAPAPALTTAPPAA